MILLLDTSTPVCKVWVQADSTTSEYTWEAGRGLSLGLLRFMQKCLADVDAQWSDLSGIVVFKGPGSFTGLRIGISVVNALAETRNLPIIGMTGDDWRAGGLVRLHAGESDGIVLPEYGGEAHITMPRK